MESWSFGPEGKGLMFTDEMDLPIDAFARSRKGLIGWDINYGLISDREAVESMEYMDLGFSEITKKTFHSNTTVGVIAGEIGSESSKRVASPTMITSNLPFGKEESSSKLSSSLMESNSQDSSLIDLKLGRLVDCKDLKERTVISTADPSLPAKRTRTSSYSQTPFCQVLGCNTDLSSSKDYHKRHKVCEVHTKTPKVIVNGIEQRFCQQCSRFHLLVEFDDGKRSCRKRLAGHNARRRKPQFSTFSGKPHKLLESYRGTKFLATSLPRRTPFVFPDILAGGILYPERYDQASWNRDVKLGEKSIYSPQLEVPTNGQLLPKSFFHPHGNDKQYSPGIPPSATEDYAVFDTAPSVQELSEVSHSNCALSLLSAKSQDFTSHSAGIPMAMPLLNQASCANHNVIQISDKPLGISSSEKYTPNGFYSSGMNSLEIDQMESIMVSNAGHAVNCEVQADESFQGSDFLNAKYCLSPGHGSTVDLLQLSSHLQRVERQRNSIQVKQEDLCCFLTT